MPWVGDTPTRTDGTRTGQTVWQQAAVAVETILSADHDTHDQDMANMVGDCINRNGANTVTADISWGSFKLTNLGDGVNPNDAVNKNQMDTADAALQAAIDGLEADKLSAVVEDTSPQLGGHLDVNGFNIVSVSNGDVILTPDGTGKIVLDAAGGEVVIQNISYPKTPGTDGQVLVTNGVDAADWGNSTINQAPTSPEQAIVGGTIVTWAHGMAVKPHTITLVLVCKVADQGFSVGDEIYYNLSGQTSDSFVARGLAVRADATNVEVAIGNTPQFAVTSFTTFTTVYLDAANDWALVIKVTGAAP